MKSTNRPIPVVFVAGLVVITAFTGCWKKSGEAVVVEKEYIAAGEVPETPSPGPTTSSIQPEATPITPTTSPSESSDAKWVEAPPLAEDEIVVGNHVMKKDVRGTSKDPRAKPGVEQWRIAVRIRELGRECLVQGTKEQYERLKIGDRVKVKYREGKYTGTVWWAELVD